MTTLPDFLMARIDEDEAAARDAYELVLELNDAFAPPPERIYAWRSMATPFASAVARGPVHEYIAHHDPARALRECEAKRRAIEAAWEDHHLIDGDFGSGRSMEQLKMGPDYPVVVIALASVYADHPDYNPEWAT